MDGAVLGVLFLFIFFISIIIIAVAIATIIGEWKVLE